MLVCVMHALFWTTYYYMLYMHAALLRIVLPLLSWIMCDCDCVLCMSMTAMLRMHMLKQLGGWHVGYWIWWQRAYPSLIHQCLAGWSWTLVMTQSSGSITIHLYKLTGLGLESILTLRSLPSSDPTTWLAFKLWTGKWGGSGSLLTLMPSVFLWVTHYRLLSLSLSLINRMNLITVDI